MFEQQMRAKLAAEAEQQGWQQQQLFEQQAARIFEQQGRQSQQQDALPLPQPSSLNPPLVVPSSVASQEEARR